MSTPRSKSSPVVDLLCLRLATLPYLTQVGAVRIAGHGGKQRAF